MAVSTAFPNTLPLPTFEGYSIEPLDVILRTDMESGPARQRRRFTQAPTKLPVRWRFTAHEFMVFESWFKNKAKAGGAWFSVTLLGGLGMTDHEARFVGRGQAPYNAQPHRGGPGDGARWIVTSALEVRDRPVLSEEALDIVLNEDALALLSTISTFDTFVNNDLFQNTW